MGSGNRPCSHLYRGEGNEPVKEEGIDKKELGREKFLERTWEWKEEYGGTITSQLKNWELPVNWDRERFTMDEGCSKAVEEVFN